MGKLSGQTVLITGAARGLGRDCALHLASLGADVGVIDIDMESFKQFEGEAELLTAENVIAELRNLGVKAHGVEADVGNRDQLFAAVNEITETLGPISILVANAGGGMGPPDGNKATLMDWDMYHTVIDRNIHGTVYSCNAVAPAMKERGQGKIVTVASVGGLMANSDGAYAHYALSKAAIIHYTHYLAQELGGYGINANCIAPGFMGTGRLLAQYKMAGEETFLSRTAIKRFGYPSDYSKAIEFLVTDQSDYVNGHVLEVSGGVSGRMRVN